MDVILSESKFENCLNYSLSSVVNRLAGLGCSSSCAGHDIEFWVVTNCSNPNVYDCDAHLIYNGGH